MVMLEKKKSLKDLSAVEREVLLKKLSTELSPEEKDLKLMLLEEKIGDIERGENFADLGPDDLVTINVPLMPDGNMFNINGKKYFGRQVVTKRLAFNLMERVSSAFRGEKELLQHRGNATSTRINENNSATIERYRQIAGNGEGV